MERTPREIFAHHAEALMAGDIDGIVADCTDDAVFITPSGSLSTARTGCVRASPRF